MQNTITQIQMLLEKLSPTQQVEVLQFAQELAQGIEGKDLMERAKSARFDAESLAEMQAAIEEGCEQVDINGW